MFEIFLTDIADENTERVADLLTVDSRDEAHEICVAMQPWLREGVEAHFVRA